MKVTLQPYERVDIAQRGQTIVYLAGASELSFETAVGNFRIPSGSQVTLPSVFEKVSIQNMSGIETESELLFVEGEYARLSDVSFVQIQGITNTISAQIVNKLAAEIVNTVDIRQITETLTAEISNTVDIRAITETLNIRQITETLTSRPDTGASFSANDFVFDAGLSVSLAAEPKRKELLILATDSNTGNIDINGLSIEAGDSFSFENFGGPLTITGAQGDGFKVCEVLYAA
ncbi:hypothetical protein V6238_00240 [Marinomonas arenicola]|uniref:hypothetical protein n=1 Tax=Marinomonas arenicola TaxID=569601 RepID=UPI00311E6256